MSSNIRVKRICEFCSLEFEAKTTVTKYCSHNCARKANKAKLKEEKVQKSNNETKAEKEGIDIEYLKILNQKEILSITETCTLLSIHRTTLWRMIKDGRLNAGNLGSKVIIRRSDIDKLFEK
jgi:excisionase family DNA binding protein